MHVIHGIKTDRQVMANRPDIIIKNKKEKTEKRESRKEIKIHHTRQDNVRIT
jgi:hypothetical protein